MLQNFLGRQKYKKTLSVELPRVGAAVAVGEAPLQFVCGQRVEVKFVLVIDAAAHGLDNLLCQFGDTVRVAPIEDGLRYLHVEILLDAGEVEVRAVQTPPAGTDVVEHQRHRAALPEGDFIHLPRRVEGTAISVEVHRAGLVYVEVVPL